MRKRIITMTTTTFENKCAILAELWLDYRYDDQFVEFISYNDLGLPLAYAIDSGIVETTDKATSFVDETFDNLLGLAGVEDNEWQSLSEIIRD